MEGTVEGFLPHHFFVGGYVVVVNELIRRLTVE